MSKIDLNLQFLFNEYELIDRYKKAAELGYKFVELQNPYGIDLTELKLLISDLGLKQVLINVDVLDESTGIMNLALNPNKKDEFFKMLMQSTASLDRSFLILRILFNMILSLKTSFTHLHYSRAVVLNY